MVRLCEREIGFQWLCDGVGINYHTLADFRVAHGDLLDRLLSESVAALCASGLMSLERLSLDGIRVRASTGPARFADGPPWSNGQLIGDPLANVVVGVDVDTSGSDHGWITPMLRQIQHRYGRTPRERSRSGVHGTDPYKPRERDGAGWQPGGSAWPAPPVRPSTSCAACNEHINADLRDRGPTRLSVPKPRSTSSFCGMPSPTT